MKVRAPLSTQHTQIDIAVLKDYFLGLQDRITNAMSTLDGKAFAADEWQNLKIASSKVMVAPAL